MAKNMADLHGHTAVVTGASSGIGLQFCHRLAERGCNLVMISNEADALQSAADNLSDRYGVTARSFCLDLTLPDVATQVEQYLEANAPDADIMINNAGIFSFQPLTEMTPGRTDCFIDLHVRAVTDLSRLMTLRWRQRGCRGWLLNMSSMSCWMPMPGLSMYAATKAYIRVLTRSLHYEMRDYGISVCVACPGGIATDLFGLPPKLQRLAVRIGALDTPEAFTRKALRRLFAGRRQYINGLLNRISIVAVGLTPTPLRMLVKHRLLDRGITR
ncbi:MAG: SDR family NAD(P)-dependent oxidoreductase [Muribaculaceae bacterium]|nr:SDR family NAD(P)-dependent oxidoreductase [Muribaculaceae bacterium]